MLKRYIGDLFFTTRWYLLAAACSALFFISFFVKPLFTIAAFAALGLLAFTLIDYLLLFARKKSISGERILPQRFSLGDDNIVRLELYNHYPFAVYTTIIDEQPEQLQARDFRLKQKLAAKATTETEYHIRPTTRGEYHFGKLLCYTRTPMGLLQRRIAVAETNMVKVYPSFVRLKKYRTLAATGHMLSGMKKIRRLGHSLEFEKIKEYVQGDDVRTVNWKATARTSRMMVNTFTDTRQQQIYCVIDKGRTMKMPFDNMTLLDHSINASLALMNIALMKQDKAGLITFANKVHDIVPGERRTGQLYRLLEILYRQETDFKESSYERLWNTIHRRINQRSLILLFTNFETYSSLERQLPYLRSMAARHLVCVIFFQNTLLKDIQEKQPESVEDIYVSTIAERFNYEKKQIVKELQKHGILSILTTPEHLTIDVINKYLELKARHMV